MGVVRNLLLLSALAQSAGTLQLFCDLRGQSRETFHD
jgi:hypothetical protein